MPHKSKKFGDFETVLAEIHVFVRGRLGRPFLGWRMQCELLRTDGFSPRGIVDTKQEDTNGHKRYPARTSITHCCDRAGPDGDEHSAGSEQELNTRYSWTEPGDAQTQMDFIMVSKKLEARRVQVLDFDWSKTDHTAVFAVLSLKSTLCETFFFFF